MVLHAKAKLGLAGRVVLVAVVEEGLSLGAAAAAFSVSPATAHRWWHGWFDGGRQASALLDRSSRPHRSLRLLAAELQERICDCRRKTGWGPRLVAGATGFAHSTVWKVLKRAGLSRRPASLKESANRYEWPWRSVAHGHKPLRALPAARAPRHRRPLPISTRSKRRNASRLRRRARDRRRPLPARLRRAPRRRESPDRHRLRRASARLLRHPWDHGEAADDRQRLHLRAQPPATRAARSPRHPPPEDPALPATHKRKGRALPPNDGTRMGVRARLPLTSTPQCRPATLARQLQPATATQLTRRPATHQPRSQRPWVGQLVRASTGQPVGSDEASLRPSWSGAKGPEPASSERPCQRRTRRRHRGR